MAEIPTILYMVYIVFLREYMHQTLLLVLFTFAVILSYVGQFWARKKGITNKNDSIVGYILSSTLLIMYLCASTIPTFNHEIWKWAAYIIMALYYSIGVMHRDIHNQTSAQYILLYLLTFFSTYELCR